MIDVAKDSGADAVKFQTFTASEFCIDDSQQFSYFSQGKEVSESMLKMFSRYEFKSINGRNLKIMQTKLTLHFYPLRKIKRSRSSSQNWYDGYKNWF